MKKCIYHYIWLSSAGEQGLRIFYAFSLYKEGIRHLKRMELGCWGAPSMLDCCSLLFAMEHLLKNSLGDFWVFQDQQKKQHCQDVLYIGALWYWQMPSHFIMLQSRWQKSVAVSRNSPHSPTKNMVLKGKVWHTKSSKHKKTKPLPNHFCLLWACQSRTDFLNRKGYIMLRRKWAARHRKREHEWRFMALLKAGTVLPDQE